MFYEMAERANFVQRSPTRVAQQQYFDKFIKPSTTRLHSQMRRHTYQGKSIEGQSSHSFIPLRDLLSKNHSDRVQDYLHQMDGQTQKIQDHNSQLDNLHFSAEEPLETVV